jgi:hypothetical protein
MGGARYANQPQPVYRGSRLAGDYRPYVAGGVIALAALIVGGAFWWRSRKVRQPLRDLKDRERRRWEGHKIEPRKPRQP